MKRAPVLRSSGDFFMNLTGFWNSKVCVSDKKKKDLGISHEDVMTENETAGCT
jgi:hypothetical protein